MRSPAILAHLGLFVQRGFLSRESCRLIRGEMTAAARAPALIRPAGEAGRVLDENVRRTGIAQVPAPTTALVADRLLASRPDLEAHFKIPLAGCQGPQFYIYDVGDFFVAHRDRDDTDPTAPEWVLSRQVSVSIFLNCPAGGPDGEDYEGGELVFYGRRGDRLGAGFALPLAGEEGMLLAFRSDWIHEVRPVTRGRRYTIVTWYI